MRRAGASTGPASLDPRHTCGTDRRRPCGPAPVLTGEGLAPGQYGQPVVLRSGAEGDGITGRDDQLPPQSRSGRLAFGSCNSGVFHDLLLAHPQADNRNTACTWHARGHIASMDLCGH